MKIFVDFEATDKKEIISIGATTEKGETFYALVKPQFSSLTQYLSQLIHITNETLEKEKELDEVFKSMYNWLWFQCSNAAEWEFFSYGKDNEFILASIGNIHSEKATILASIMTVKIINVCNMARTFFHGPISLIHAFNFITQEETKQTHNSLDDALMLQDIYNYITTNEPLSYHPLNPSSTNVKMPSGRFWCSTGNKNSKRRYFENIEEALDWYINTILPKVNRSRVHRENIMKKIMVSISKKQPYNGYYWFREKIKEN